MTEHTTRPLKKKRPSQYRRRIRELECNTAQESLSTALFDCLCKPHDVLTKVTIVSLHLHKPLNAHLPAYFKWQWYEW